MPTVPRPALPPEMRTVLRAVSTLRPYTLAFSVPYLWLWTQGLPVGTRTATMVTHALGLLACVAALEAVDSTRGLHRRLAFSRDPRWNWRGLALVATPVCAAGCLLAALPLVALHPLATLVIAGTLGLGLTFAWLPAEWKYLVAPEVAAPLGLLVLPAIALERYAGASIDRLTVIAGAAFLAALVLACHLRDLEADLSADVPTLATRRPGTARWWMWTTAILGTVTTASALYVPLEAWEAAALFGAGAFLTCSLLPRRTSRVPAMAAAHAVFAVSLLLR